MNTPTDFEFDFNGTERLQFLEELNALYSELGDDSQCQTPDNNPASRLFAKLNQEIAEFAKYPTIEKLSESYSINSGRTAPKKSQEISQDHKFYWIKLPITLFPSSNWYFNKLECLVEFSSEFSEAHLQPKVHSIFPERKFQQLFKANGNIEISIGGNMEFEANTGQLNLQAGEAQVTTNAGAKAKLGSNFGLISEFSPCSLKADQIDHTDPGDSQVFWRINGAEFFQEDKPNLMVILQIPKSVQQVKIDAALQAYHRPNFWTTVMGNLGDLMRFLSNKGRTFYEKGAPIKDITTWDISPNL
ncbi:hypothetical protein [Mastigocoleus sp. MO_188.B34]|uniref:hypothetical protein n=1 Tax=Mastigocoleus sp. MO_188.B34 TaxID=3036635 RepID=UPI002634DA91|nr:hypothetical protein [Mastigocoleus sp. MO_188.B34]MDJ0695366.1 hypothetical protein [Mastigocoleus sp. MO_188.B34]